MPAILKFPRRVGSAGGTLGYNLQTGVWVWGVEGDIDYANLKGTGDSDLRRLRDQEYLVRNACAAASAMPFDRWLPYLTGGAALGNV